MKKRKYYEELRDRNFKEELDKTPVAVPLHLRAVETTDQKFQRMLKAMMEKNALEQEEETDEDLVDFDVREKPIKTVHNSYVTKADIKKARDYEQERKQKKTDDETPVVRKPAKTGVEQSSTGDVTHESHDSAPKGDSKK